MTPEETHQCLSNDSNLGLWSKVEIELSHRHDHLPREAGRDGFLSQENRLRLLGERNMLLPVSGSCKLFLLHKLQISYQELQKQPLPASLARLESRAQVPPTRERTRLLGF